MLSGTDRGSALRPAGLILFSEPKINTSTSVLAGCLASLPRDKSFIVKTKKGKKKKVTFHPYRIPRVSKCVKLVLFLSADF